MSQVDLQSLGNVLLHTLDPDNASRAAAEAQLQQLETVAGSHALFLQLVTLDSVPLHVRHAASLRLKNLYHEYWSIREGEACRISDADRKMMREHILEAVVRQSNPQLRVQLLQVLHYLWPTDTPNEWPELVPQILKNVQTGMSASPPDFMRVYGSICALLGVMKRYEFRPHEVRTRGQPTTYPRAPMYAIVDATFPLLLQLLQGLAGAQQKGNETWEMLRILVKIFVVCTHVALPPAIRANFDGQCKPWMDVLMFLLEAPLPGLESVGAPAGQPLQSARPEHIEQLTVSPAWKVKKWAAQSLLRLYSRFGRPGYVGQGERQTAEEKAMLKSWAHAFEAHCTTRALSAFMTLLKIKTGGGFVTERVRHQAYTFIAVCCASARFYKMLKPALPFLIQEAILQELQLTAADVELWKEDPQEFIRHSLDLLEEFNDPRMAATGLLFELVKLRTSGTLQLTLNTITHVFETYEAAAPAGRNYVQKEGAMRMFGALKRLLLSKKEFRAPIESLLIRHVMPEFASPHGFLRQRAVWVLRKYTRLAWTNKEAHAQSVRLILERLTDPELPVKIEAWEATSYLIDDESMFELIRPALPMLMDQFFVLYEEVGNEKVVGVLGTLVEKFDEAVTPYAARLVEKLVAMFLQLIGSALGTGPADPNAQEEGDEFDETCTTAFQCLRTINSVLYAVADHRADLLLSMLPLLLPVMDRCVNDDCVEFYDDVLETVSIFTYFPPTIPDSMWAFLPRITGSFHTWASDFLTQMLPVFDNFLTKGSAQLCTPQGAPLLQAMFSIADVILKDQERLIDSTNACVLVESMLANLRGRVDGMLGPVVQLCGTRLLTIVHMEQERAEKRRQREAAAAAAAAKRGAKAGIKKGKKSKKGRGKSSAQSPEDEEEENENQDMLQLKFALLDDIGIAAHYNPALFAQVIRGCPDQFAGPLFNTWISYLQTMEDDFDSGKNAVLGLASLFLLPLNQVPPLWAPALPTVLEKLLKLLEALSTLLAEQGEGDAAPEGGDEEGTTAFEDVDENEDVYRDSEADNDSEEAEEASDDDTRLFVDDFEKAMIGNPEGNSRFVSPLDDVDPFVFFTQAVDTLARQEPAFYQQWINSIGPAGQALLHKHAEQAKRHAQEMAEAKAKEAEKLKAAAATASS